MVTGGLIAAGLAYAPAHRRTAVQVGVVAAVAVLLLVLAVARTATLS
jgi:hypothetical protein